MANRITAYNDTLRFLGLFAEYAPILPPSGGVPTFIERITRQPFGFHPWIWMAEGWLDSPSCIVTGAKGRGKTSALKILLLTLMMLSMGGERCRALIDNMKNNDGTSEMDVPLRVYGDRAVEVQVRSFGINILDHLLGLTQPQLLRLIISLLYDLTGQPVPAWQATAIKVGLRRLMEHDEKRASMPLLAQVVSRLPVDLVADDVDRARNELINELGDDLSVQMVEDLHRPLVMQQDTKAIVDAIRDAGNLLQNVLVEGPESGIFGNNSIAQALHEPDLTVIDYTGVSDIGNTLFHGVINQVTAADNARTNPQFLYDVIGQDEVYKSWRYKTFALAESDAEWQQRDRNPFKMRIVQQLESYQTVGAAGSQEREMAMNSINGAGMHWVFGGQSKSSYKNLQNMLDFSDLDLAMARKQPAGCLLIKPQHKPVLHAQIPLLTDLEREVARSNDSMRRRIKGGTKRSGGLAEELLRQGLGRAA